MNTMRRALGYSVMALALACNDDPSAASLRPTGSEASPVLPAEGDAGLEEATVDAAEPAPGEDTDAASAEGDAGGLDGGAVEPDAGTDAGADAAAPDAALPELAIAGRWHSEYGGVEEISSSAWVSYGTSEVVQYDNAARTVILQNPADDLYNPSKFSKVVWTTPSSDGFYVCTIVYDAASAGEALNTSKVADASAPAQGGCGGFPWTHMGPPIELEGRWHSNFGGVTAIDSDAWGSTKLVRYDNVANTAVTQNDANASYNPGKYNKLVWTEPSAGKLYYCTVDFGLDSAAAAQSSSKMADTTDPSKSGCGGFSWTELGPVIAVEGSYQVAGTPLAISSDRWGDRRITRYDNAAQRAVVRNADATTYDLVVWTRTDGVLYVCTTARAQASANQAESAAASAVPENLTTGCLGAAWTRLDDAP